MCTQADHDAIKRDREAFSKLEPIGQQRMRRTSTSPPYALDLRNCSCGSTLSIIIPITEDK